MGGCIFFRVDRSEKQGDGVALHVREQLECIRLYSGTDDQVESLWMRIKGQANTGDTVVDIYQRPPDKEEDVHEALCEQLK